MSSIHVCLLIKISSQYHHHSLLSQLEQIVFVQKKNQNLDGYKKKTRIEIKKWQCIESKKLLVSCCGCRCC